MPILHGEKYACDSCIKGHRVSGCTHNADRPLKHINPKGRPVKQCEHCQKARKTKSHHARCDCGTKKDKIKTERAAGEGELDGHLGVEAALSMPGFDDHECRCYIGNKCLCGTKKEPLDLKLDTKMAHCNKVTKPRLTSAHSETVLTVFANGHHKPCHRLNNTAHTSGMPYKIPRHHTTHGSISSAHHSHDNLADLYSSTMNPARRSVDNLNLSTSSPFGYFAPQNAAESVPMTPLNGALDTESSLFDPAKYASYSQASALSKMVGEREISPAQPVNDGIASSQNQQMPWGMFPSSQFGMDSLSTSPTGDYFPTPESEFGFPSASTNPWSAGDLPLVPNKLSDSLTQPISHSGESNQHSIPGMTTSSSGAQSEVGEPIFFGDMDMTKIQQQPTASDQSLLSDSFPFREPNDYRLSSSSLQQDLHQQLPTSLPTSEPHGSLDIDFMKRASDRYSMQFGGDAASFLSTSGSLDSSTTTATAAFAPSSFPAQFSGMESMPDELNQANTDGAGNEWYHQVLGTGMGVNAFSIPSEPLSSSAQVFPDWL
ncbi:hypothetical protein K490DRAFT_30903 [Saccharata proteae CBS 121410]|uniref:Copper-fist domain-containing protein n=1 Tax=Saccharata proteae CBS 121410 TaxID=1314787 RepID=A0A9P4LYI9_9PEZI|nr:hypothetical protein K490DRAFT_30903 [Saccharata proteae CBS 121410]